VSLKERSAALDGLLEGMSAPVRNLVRLLVAHGRFALLTEVVAEFRAIVEAASGVLRIVVSSAVPLTRAAERRIEGMFAVRLAHPVRLETVHDPALIGGLVIRMGDRVIDDSVRSHLQQLQAAMA